MPAPDNPDRRILSEDEVRWLLNRAIKLDEVDSGSLTVDQFRMAAGETGISDRALEQALLDLKEQARVANSVNLGVEPGHIPLEVLVRNVAPVVGGILTIRMLLEALPVPGRPELIEAAIFPVGLLVGVLLAQRLRAPLARFLLTGLALATGVEFLLFALTGEPVIRGASAHWQVIGASYLATAAFLRFRSRPGGGPPSSADLPSGRVDAAAHRTWLASATEWLRNILGPRKRSSIQSPLEKSPA